MSAYGEYETTLSEQNFLVEGLTAMGYPSLPWRTLQKGSARSTTNDSIPRPDRCW